MADPAATFEVNVRGTWTLLEACRRGRGAGGRRRLLRQGLRPARGAALPGGDALRPASPYEASKAAADAIALSYRPAYGLPVAVTRFANIYGGGDLNFSRLIPEAIVAVLEGRRPAIRSDGSPERDFLYVEDAVAAYLAVEHAVGAGGPGGGRGVQRRRRAAALGRRGAGDDRRGQRPAASSPNSAAPATRPARSTASSSTRRSCAS